MANPLLSNFELAGQQIDIRDSASFELATAAKQAADSALDSVLNITYDGTEKTLVIDRGFRYE